MNDAFDPLLQGLNDCGCCDGVDIETPMTIDNRPGLSAITYRVGTQSRFLESMLAALSQHPELANLRIREPDDFAIALCDSWATIADILTFYQERLANEAFLRTALDRVSILQLARLIGYELAPGVAADTFLAFSLEESPGSTSRTTIDVGVKVQSVPGPGETAQTFETVEKLEARVEWNAIKPVTTKPISIIAGTTELYLKGINTQLLPGDPILIIGDERLADSGSEAWDFRLLETVTSYTDRNITRITWNTPLGSPYASPAASKIRIYALRQRAALFGHNAVDPRTLKLPNNSGLLQPPSNTQWKGFSIPTDAIELDLAYPKIVRNSWIVLSTGAPQRLEVCRVSDVSFPSLAKFALSGKATRITPDLLEHRSDFSLRETIVYAQSEELLAVDSPDWTLVKGSQVVVDSTLDGVDKGRMLMVCRKDLAKQTVTRELVEIALIEPVGLQSRVTFSTALKNSYDRDKVVFNANVLAATHGETVQEILGSSAAGVPYQRLPLRQSPLTYVSAANARGMESTLKLRVNDVLWHEVDALFGQGPRDRVYITRADDEAKVTAQFGDSVTGAVPPSGQNNVRAAYRKGIGKQGLVKAGQLSLLLSRPLGVKEVVNPLDATGAKDPETIEQGRRNAPLTVLTLGRVVSLQDYEDYAQAFAGVAKALATWTWHRQERGVFLTIAGEDGAPLPASGKTSQNLIAAIRNAGDPLVPINVATYRPAYFRIEGKLKIDPDYLFEDVNQNVQHALSKRFSFNLRTFGQPVMLSDVIAVIQNVTGVIAVDIDKFYRSGSTPLTPPPVRLLADMPVAEAGGDALAAELLLFDPSPPGPFGAMP